MPQRQMTLTSQGNMATRPVSNMDKLIKLLRTIEIEVQDKSGKGAWTGARLWYHPLKTPQKREPRRKKKKARRLWLLDGTPARSSSTTECHPTGRITRSSASCVSATSWRTLVLMWRAGRT